MLLILLTITLFSCVADDPVVPSEEKGPKLEMKYLALGDSYTIGQSVPESSRWPVQLTKKLVDNGIVTSDTTQIIAVTGWTTQNLLKGIESKNPAHDFDLVSLLIGVNNYYQFKEAALPDYEKEFVQLLDSAIHFAGGDKKKVFVVSIPDYAYTPSLNGSKTVSEGIDLFNASNKRLTDSMGVDYVNVTPISRRGLDEPDLVASDDLHPSGKQYTLWVEEMYPLVKQKVQ